MPRASLFLYRINRLGLLKHQIGQVIGWLTNDWSSRGAKCPCGWPFCDGHSTRRRG